MRWPYGFVRSVVSPAQLQQKGLRSAALFDSEGGSATKRHHMPV